MTKTQKEEAQVRRKPGTSLSDLKSQYDPAEEVKHLRGEIAKLERDHEAYTKEHGRLSILFDDLRRSIEELDPPEIDYKPPKRSTVTSPVVHVSHMTDWHLGAIQNPEEVEGFREFNPEVLELEMVNCELSQLQWCELHRKNYTINERRNIVTGDLISGGIHDELLWTNAYPEPVQAVRAGELLAKLVAMQSPHYQKVIVDFITEDNHARLTKKPQATEAGLNTWNYVIGFYAKERLKSFGNVEFNIYPQLQKVIKVANRQYLITHGHHVRGWAGFPYYGIERKAGREAMRRMRRVVESQYDVEKAIGSLFHKIIMGHWHAPLAHPWYWIGGSASGTTAYDHKEGREAQPIQCAWMVHPKWGEFDRTEWLLTSKK